MTTSAENFIRFEEVESPSPKTKRWRVVNIRTGEIVGIIRWWGAWWKYCFFPHPDCLFDANCLEMIIAFVREKMHERKPISSHADLSQHRQ